jgi:predicted subunit of tRNA(5-methylaminomethyl-2-thiouridylate) methyltransferase
MIKDNNVFECLLEQYRHQSVYIPFFKKVKALEDNILKTASQKGIPQEDITYIHECYVEIIGEYADEGFREGFKSAVRLIMNC